jgi:hypothetical protein
MTDRLGQDPKNAGWYGAMVGGVTTAAQLSWLLRTSANRSPKLIAGAGVGAIVGFGAAIIASRALHPAERRYSLPQKES